MVAGLPDIDVNDMIEHTEGNLMTDPQFSDLRTWFEAVLHGLDVEQRAKVLSYASGSGRLPAAGFRDLQPRFNVQVNVGEPPDNLPTAHTCANQLCMPRYTSREELHAKLIRAINLATEADGGFHFV